MGKKKEIKVKEPVRIREKTLANGNRSLYLDIYKDGERRYKFLKLYLIPEKDSASKMMNKNTWEAAMAIKAMEIQSIIQEKAGICPNSALSKMSLIDWMKTVRQRKLKNGFSDRRANAYDCAIKHLETYLNGRSVKLKDVDKDFLLGIINFLSTDGSRRDRGKVISKSTAFQYFSVLVSSIKEAVCDGILSADPTLRIKAEDKKPIMPTQKRREFLTIEEVKQIEATEWSTQVKNAFLFSCFTGIRMSDVVNLSWEDIKNSDNGKILVVTMKKTKKVVSVPLSNAAMKWLPVRTDGAANSEHVFNLPQPANINLGVKRLAAKAGINKNVSFHTARHTFATMGLTLGVDIYTISNLLGHSKITTTQIYADVVNEKKVEAVNLMNKVF